MPRLDRRDRAVGHRQELGLALVHVIREAAAVPLGRQVQRSLNPVALDLYDNLLAPKLQPERDPNPNQGAGSGPPVFLSMLSACFSVSRATPRAARWMRSPSSCAWSVRRWTSRASAWIRRAASTSRAVRSVVPIRSRRR